MSDCTFHSIVSIYSCFCCGCDINMHSRRVRRRSAVVLCGREPARQAALRIRKQDPLADGLRRLHRNYPSERSCLRNVKPLSRSLFRRRPLRCDIDLHNRTTLVSFSRLLMARPSRFCARCIAGVIGCFFFFTNVNTSKQV